VQRPTRLVQHLRSYGYEPVVVTGPGTASGRWTPRDETLLQHVPPDVEVHRVRGPEPPQDGRSDRIERWTGRPSAWTRWWVDGSVTLGTAVAAQTGCELVYAWMQPYASAAAGMELARATELPWVADLGDPWALDEMIAYPSRLHRRRAVAKMQRTLSTAAAIAMSTPEAARQVRARLPAFAGTITSIPNGYEEGDFLQPPPEGSQERFTIVHTGYLHTALAARYGRFQLLRRLLGGSDPDVDVSTRSHLFLLEALQGLLERRPDLHDKVEVVFAGVMSKADEAELDGLPFVRVLGYVDHEAAVRLMRAADLLFLPMHDLPPGRRATIVPGKTYEYLASGTPILAAVPDGDARDLLSVAGNASLCRPPDLDCLARAVEERVDGLRRSESPDLELVEQFSYARLAQRLAAVFDNVLGSQRGDTAGASVRRSA